jgi:hypothetical protein
MKKAVRGNGFVYGYPVSAVGAPMEARVSKPAKILSGRAFSLLVYTEQPIPARLFLKKSRTSLHSPVQSRSENALCRSSLI